MEQIKIINFTRLVELTHFSEFAKNYIGRDGDIPHIYYTGILIIAKVKGSKSL